MESKAKIFGHPIHPMLIVFPVGLLGGSVIFDLVAGIGDYPSLFVTSYRMIIGGLIGAVAAALFGFIDWLAIPSDTRAKRIGLMHALFNVAVIVLFGASAALRSAETVPPSAIALSFSGVGFVLLLISGWLGGELVDRLGVGVDEGANLDAPNSLSGSKTRSEL